MKIEDLRASLRPIKTEADLDEVIAEMMAINAAAREARNADARATFDEVWQRRNRRVARNLRGQVT